MHTYRERAFYRSTRYLRADSSLHVFAKETHVFPLGVLGDPELQQLLEIAFHVEPVRDALSCMPISQQRIGSNYDPELHPGLQDLADIIALEADDAAIADYFPRLPDVSVSDEHVATVMGAMQRELNREASWRGQPVQLAAMPWDRQCSLTERRRYWYGVFGITPESWLTGLWSLWEVSDTEISDNLLARLAANATPAWFYPSLDHVYTT